MRSEMRRVAKALVESRSESFASRYPLEESVARLQAALAPIHPKRMRFESTWKQEPGGVRLDARFVPASGTQRFLSASSAVLTLLIAASVWALVSPGEERTMQFLVPLLTAFGILAFPFVVVALGSQREAEEARLRKAIRKALLEAEEELPAARRSEDA